MGRKKLDEPKMEIRLRVDVVIYQRIQAIVSEDGNAISTFVRTAITEKLKRLDKGSK